MTIKKYRIDNFLEAMTIVDYKKAMLELPAELGVTKSYFRRMIKFTFTESRFINSSHLIILAAYFGVSVDDLLNKTPLLCQSTHS